jgi:hypothetical protein
VRPHRDHEHRLRAVPELLVEAAIELVRRVGGQQVRVLDDERPARGRRVPGEAGVVERDRERRQREVREGEVLGELEPQLPRPPVLAAVDQV